MKTIYSVLTTVAVLLLSVTAIYAQDTGVGEAIANSSATCTISTDEARTVRVRVGPGENRTSVTFLPENVEVPVTGQIEDEDGNIWFQVDKEVAAPERAINEAWVAAEEVETAGDCEEIVNAAAPPIIPIVQRPTPDANSDSDEVPTTAIMPQGGRWTIAWGPTIIFDCADTGRETVATTEFVSASEMSFTTEVIEFGYGDPIPFIFMDAMLRNAGNDTYWGEIHYIDDDGNVYRSTVYVDAVMTRHQMVGRFITSNETCTVTFTYVANHN
jgi:hypothetical protein